MNKETKKTTIMITRELANKLKSLMQVGDNYDTVIRRLLGEKDGNKKI